MKKLNVITKSPVKLPLTLIACVILLICAFIYTSGNSSLHRSFQTATSRHPENFTELYFADYKTLPKKLKVGKIYPVPFTITNHESRTFTYQYQTVLTSKESKVTSKPIAITVDNGKSVQKTAYIIAKRPGDQVELVIRVLNKNLTIHYEAQS